MLETFVVLAEPGLSQDKFACLLKLVSTEKQKRINRYRLFKDARNTLVGDILVRSAICKRAGLLNSQLIF